MIDRDVFFDLIRHDPFDGSLSEEQVGGLERLLATWEAFYEVADRRWLSYCLATSAHETGMRMVPVEEIGKGEGHEYGKPDPETQQCYYGRGDIQTTWRDNYRRLDVELGLEDDRSCEWHAENALDPVISAHALFKGMIEGWYRAGHTLPRYFSKTVDDPYQAREIVNGDKHIVPDWADGVSIGNLIKNYHLAFLNALDEAYDAAPAEPTVTVLITTPPGVRVEVHVQEEE